jgi:hypothetical protein
VTRSSFAAERCRSTKCCDGRAARGGALGLRGLTTRFAAGGRVEAIVLRPQRRASRLRRRGAGRAWPRPDRRPPRQRLAETEAQRHRELTLIQHEHLPLIGAWTLQQAVDARRLRRNLVISGLNLAAMHSPFADQVLVWRVGPEVCIEVTGSCPPCSRMETELGLGGYNALRGGGLTARVTTGGLIRVGAVVELERVEAARDSHQT